MAFTRKTFDFLESLDGNNSKEWFNDHRADYETHWKEAALAFIDSVTDQMQARGLKAEARLNGSLRRINRDVRFSKDKTPYKARLHMIFWAGAHPNRSPAMHIVLNPKGVGYGAGQFGIEPKALAQLRDRMMDPAECAALIKALDKAQSVGCRMGEPDLVRLPKGFEAEGRQAELLRHKAIVARTHDGDTAVSKIVGKAGPEWALKTTDALLPLIRWLQG